MIHTAGDEDYLSAEVRDIPLWIECCH